ncbi:MAG TPA: hypothetical protein VF801_11860 [Rhodocyclaceae bacterium]
MSTHVIQCEACGEDIAGQIHHLGLAGMDALYCSSCPRVLLVKANLLDRFRIVRPPLGKDYPGFQPYLRHLLPFYEKVEDLFLPCECGGRFGFMNPPRCPKCGGLLRGDVYGDRPIAKVTDGYAFVSVGSVDGAAWLKPA